MRITQAESQLIRLLVETSSLQGEEAEDAWSLLERIQQHEWSDEMKHPHYDVMMEWAADTSKVVQSQDIHTGEWHDHKEPPLWLHDCKYRIKPTPKPDIVCFWLITPGLQSCFSQYRHDTHNLRLTFDGETGKLTKAEVL